VNIQPERLEAYQLFHQGAQLFAKMHIRGFRVDEAYCSHMYKKLGKRIDNIRDGMDQYKEIRIWKRVFKDKFNMDSDHQLRHILVQTLKEIPINDDTKMTKANNVSVDSEVLEDIGLPFIEDLLKIKKYAKVRDTFLASIMRETVNGYVHPFFGLVGPRTYRSSSSDPNWQNFPKRDEEMQNIVRRAIIPRPGHMLLGADYGSIEVRTGCWYHHDQVMIDYLSDPKKNMHRDTACDIYYLTPKQVSEQARYSAKNGFVFPEFYGSAYWRCAKALWRNIDKLQLKVDEVPMRQHLRKNGIKTYEQFAEHVRKVENIFWYKRFKTYTSWKEQTLEDFDRKGYVDLLTGFRCSGAMERNQILNYPFQGTAFHCLLKALVMMEEDFKDRKFKSVICGQIHDEGIIDTKESELGDIIECIKENMLVKLKEEFPWITTNMEVEIKSTEVDGDWFTKHKVATFFHE
jgi:DNA polymerase-1